ncbi:hypothetical protein M8J75_004026 [Diaphorina citri]|nr:hypothetical protein M8J75_004026 [Diaphorina citri]
MSSSNPSSPGGQDNLQNHHPHFGFLLSPGINDPLLSQYPQYPVTPGSPFGPLQSPVHAQMPSTPSSHYGFDLSSPQAFNPQSSHDQTAQTCRKTSRTHNISTSDDDSFTTVTSNRKKRRSQNLPQKTVRVSNRYDALRDMDADDNDDNDIGEEVPPKIKIPPIFIAKNNLAINELMQALKRIDPDFYAKDSRDFLRVEFSSTDTYRGACSLLDSKNLQYHSYRLPQDKTIDVVIKHLPVAFTDQEVADELQIIGFKDFKLMRVWDREKKPIPVVSVYLDRKHDKNKEIFDLSRFMNCVVSVEPKKKSHHIPQCTKCQRYGHTKNYCKLSPRCLFCSLPHPSSECEKKKEDSIKVCANCGENHTANFKGCAYYSELRKKRFRSTHQALPRNANPAPAPDFSPQAYPYLPSQRTPVQPVSQLNQSAVHKLAILNWNANGIDSKKMIFTEFLVRHNIDIACVTETHLTSCQRFKVPNYRIYRNDREPGATPWDQKAAGGVAVFIKKSIYHEPIILPPMICFEIQGIIVSLKNGSKLKIFSAYRSRKSLSIRDLNVIFTGNDTPTMLIGDINCKHPAWNSVEENPNGKKLFDLMNRSDWVVSGPEESTYYPSHMNRHPDVLDIVITKNVTCIMSQEVFAAELPSDHAPVVIELDAVLLQCPPRLKLINGPVDWELFREHLNSKINIPSSLQTVESIDNTVDSFTDAVKQSVYLSSGPPKYSTYKFVLPFHLRSLIAYKHRVRRRWQRNKLAADKRLLNILIKKVKLQLDQFWYDGYQEYLQDLHPDDGTLYKETKRILRQHDSIPPLEVSQDVYATSPLEKCEVFADMLEKSFSVNENNFDPAHVSQVKEFLEKDHASAELPIPYVNPSEIHTEIKLFKTKKASGHDLIPNEVLKELPFGFREGHSTIHQMAKFSEFVNNSFENQKQVLAIFLDFQAAFDRVWHDGLISKMKHLQFPNYLTGIVSSFLKERTFSVKVDDNFSTIRPIRASVPQGSVLGPILFNLYVSDIGHNYFPMPPNCFTGMFADDKVLACADSNLNSAQTCLQALVDDVVRWCQQWCVTISIAKSEAKIFSLSRQPDPPCIKINSENIPWKDEAVRYLGVWFDRRLTWGAHIRKKTCEGYQRLSKLFPIFNKKSSISMKSALLIYKTILLPVITYGCPVWLPAAESHIKKLQIFQNKVLRIITKAPWFVRNKNIQKDLKIAPIYDIILKRTIEFIKDKPHGIGERTYVRRLRVHLPQNLRDVVNGLANSNT